MKKKELRLQLSSRRNADGTAVIYLRYGANDKFSTGIYAKELIDGIIVRDKYAHLKNCELASKMDEVNVFLLKGESFRRACELAFSKKRTLVDVYKEFMATKKGGTWGIYRDGLDVLTEYGKDCPIDNVTVRWLTEFDGWMQNVRGLSTNTRSMRMRCLRAACNYAISNEYTTNYPFRNFHIKQEETRKRCLTRQQMAALIECPCEEWQEVYRDIFILMFYLIGINTVDLWNLTHDNVEEGYLCYRRQKTHKQYRIKIEPEAAAIINKYKGRHHLLAPADTTSHTTFGRNMNDCLKRLGSYTRSGLGGKKNIERLMPDGISAYWARHTWATLAYEVGVSVDVIAQALGHSDTGHATTMIYIKPNAEKVDKANRMVIDYVVKK